MKEPTQVKNHIVAPIVISSVPQQAVWQDINETTQVKTHSANKKVLFDFKRSRLEHLKNVKSTLESKAIHSAAHNMTVTRGSAIQIT